MSHAVPRGARMEVKFEASELRQHEIMQWLRLHRDGFHEVHPPRTVNNVYFDSPDFVAVSDNLAGVSARTKVRLRWYGDANERVAGSLELKHKRNGFGWKTQQKVEIPLRRHGVSWSAFRRDVSAQLAGSGAHWFRNCVQPSLLNVYRRRYFLTADGLVRVTVDTDQRAWEQRIKPFLNLAHRLALPARLIVEVKFDRADLERAASVVQGIPIRVSRHSKYLAGSSSGIF